MTNCQLKFIKHAKELTKIICTLSLIFICLNNTIV